MADVYSKYGVRVCIMSARYQKDQNDPDSQQLLRHKQFAFTSLISLLDLSACPFATGTYVPLLYCQTNRQGLAMLVPGCAS